MSAEPLHGGAAISGNPKSAQGVTIVGEPVTGSLPGLTTAFLTTPCGALIELRESP